MIEISTISDIRQIENKLIGDFTGRQLLTFVIGGILDILIYFTTHSIPLIFFVSLIILIIGFIKKGNLTAIEYLSVLIDKNRQAKIRTFRNQNVLSTIEFQCKSYKSPKKKKKKNNSLKSLFFLLIILSVPIVVNAATIDTDIEGYTEILNMMKVYVRGTGGLVLMVGCADFFIHLANENVDRLVRSMQIIGAGFFLILADNFVQAIGNADGSQTFELLFNYVSLIISFIGAVLTMLGSYKTINSIKEQNPETRSRAIKIACSGLMLVAISQSVSNFI